MTGMTQLVETMAKCHNIVIIKMSIVIGGNNQNDFVATLY